METESLVKLLRESRRTLVFTGAGISTLAGIPDFRGAGGVYSKPWEGYQVEEILSLPVFYEHPELFYRWAREFVYRLDDFEPASVHRVLATLERAGLIRAVCTQNIDMLHQKAGSREVWEIHGSPARHHCLKCGNVSLYHEIAPLVHQGKVPHCKRCGGLVKPDIVFYGENLDEALLDRAFDEFSEADTVLVLGSSLTVQPAASLPECAVRSGAKLVIVNKQPPPLDGRATLRYDDLGTLFDALERVEW